MTEFRVFKGGDCPKRLFEFRYDIYVREMSRHQRYADHRNKTIFDPLDARGINIVAFEDSEIVGCVRTNFLRDGPLGEYEELYRLDALSPADRLRASICTRLMIGQSRRRSVTTFGVMKAVYEYGMRRGIQLNFIDCNDHLVGFFEKLGYRPIGSQNHSEYGDVTILRLDVLDLERFEAVRSPFLPSLRAFLERPDDKLDEEKSVLIAAE